jgi:hypothetical protein
MTQLEYITALLSIIVGLGLTDLARSFRELVRPRRSVDWHWLPLLWAATTFLVAVQLWWNSFSFLDEATSEFFFVNLIDFVLLYLTCAFALPDPGWDRPDVRENTGGLSLEMPGTRAPLDLEAFHFSEAHRRWYFGVFIVFVVTAQVSAQVASLFAEESVNPQEIPPNVAFVGLLAALIWTDRWWVHTPVSVLCFLGVGWGTLGSIFGWAPLGELLGF